MALQHVQAQRRRRPRQPTASGSWTLLADADVLHRGRGARHARCRSGSTGRRCSARNPRLVMVSITPFGSASARSDEPVTDLTVMAEAGPAWSCGYDDHSLPPVRGGGNQAFHTAGHCAVMSLLVALLAREETGEGQHIDVSMYAASNVTTEMATLRLAGLRVGGPAPDRPPRRADADAAGAGALPRRSLRHDRRAAALAGRVRQRARRCSTASACATSSRRRSSSSSAPSASG